MNLSEYQNFVEGLASERSKQDYESRLLTSAIGLAGESGEVADLIKKWVFHGGDLSVEKLIKELGDIIWYTAFAANSLNISLQHIIDKNIEKLQDRYKSGKFTLQEFKEKENGKSN